MSRRWRWSHSVVSDSLWPPWTVAHQAPQSMGFSRQEYWSGLPFPSPGDLPDPGTEPRSPTLRTDALLSEPPGKPKLCLIYCLTHPLNLSQQSHSSFQKILLFSSSSSILGVSYCLFLWWLLLFKCSFI